MAETRDTRSRTGWVWVIVGIVAVGLIVWWVAAAVDGEDEVGVADEEITALDEGEGLGQDQELAQGADERAGEGLDRLGPTGEQNGDQIFEDQNGMFEEEQAQADRSGQILGEAPGEDQVAEPEEVEQFGTWNEQQQQQAQLGEEQAVEGAGRLGRAVEGVIIMFGEQPQQGQQQQGQQVGGGPQQDQQSEQRDQQLQQQRQQLQQSTQQLQQAQQDQHPQAFQEAANNVVQALSSLQQMGQFEQLDQPIQQLQESVQQIQPDQPLAQQEQQVRQFFNRSSQVLEQMSRELQGTQTGGGPLEQDQQQQEYGQ